MTIELTAAFGTLFEYFPDPTDASIRAMANAAITAGGGKIYLPAGQITLTAPLPIANNIQYIGLMPSMTKTTDAVIDQSFALVGGTRLIGNGTFPAFQYNDTVVTTTRTVWNGLTGIVIEGMSLEGFSRGISIGNYNNHGLAYSSIKDIVISGCASDWGLWFCNFQHCEIARIVTQECAHGQYYGGLAPFSVCAFGNSTIDEIYNNIAKPASIAILNRFSRGIVFSAGDYNNATALLNEIRASRVQCNGPQRIAQLSVAATTTSGSTSIAVPDSSQFVVGMPVIFTTTANGFTVDWTYFVLSIVDATHITVGLSRVNNAAVSATASAAMTITSRGFPNIEIIAENNNGNVQDSHFLQIDTENSPTAGVYFERAAACIATIGELNQSAVAQSNHLVLRQSTVQMHCSVPANVKYDTDGTSKLSRLDGFRGQAIQYSLNGIGVDYSTPSKPFSFIQMIAGADTKGSSLNYGARSLADFQARGGGLFISPSSSMGKKVSTQSVTGSLAFKEFVGTVVTNPTGTGVVLTLPTIVIDTNPADSLIGIVYEITNISAFAVTLNSDGTQTFTGGGTSRNVPANSTVLVTAILDRNSGTMYWRAISVAHATS